MKFKTKKYIHEDGTDQTVGNILGETNTSHAVKGDFRVATMAILSSGLHVRRIMREVLYTLVYVKTFQVHVQ